MRVAIDSGPLTSGHKVRGIGVHTKELIGAIKLLKDKEIIILAVDFEKTDLGKYNLVHYPYFHPFFLTLPKKSYTKTVVTIHDLIPLMYPKHYSPGIKGNTRFLLQKNRLKQIDAIITISETSKKDIVRLLGVQANRVHVVYLAPKDIFKRVTNHQSLITVQKKYNLPDSFVLYVGDVNYNKNILNLIKACEIAKLPLVICGKQALDIEEGGMGLDVLSGPQDWARFLLGKPHPELAHYQELASCFKGKSKILRLGFVPDKDLVSIYNLALVYCQPSFYEGFGLPVLEAFACGCPVVAAKTQALVEIAEDVAIFADPASPKDLAYNIKKLSYDLALRKRLIEKARRRVRKFSWQKTAEGTLSVYQKILQNE